MESCSPTTSELTALSKVHHAFDWSLLTTETGHDELVPSTSVGGSPAHSGFPAEDNDAPPSSVDDDVVAALFQGIPPSIRVDAVAPAALADLPGLPSMTSPPPVSTSSLSSAPSPVCLLSPASSPAMVCDDLGHVDGDVDVDPITTALAADAPSAWSSASTDHADLFLPPLDSPTPLEPASVDSPVPATRRTSKRRRIAAAAASQRLAAVAESVTGSEFDGGADDDGEEEDVDEEERRARRRAEKLAKNRLSAQQSRQRKRDTIASLSKTVEQLQAELTQHKTDKEALRAENKRLIEEVRHLRQIAPASRDDAVAKALKRFADAPQDRQTRALQRAQPVALLKALLANLGEAV